MHHGPGGVHVNPSHDVVVAEGDTLLLIAPMDRLAALEAANRPGPENARELIAISPATVSDGVDREPGLGP
jgi:hypothetical protein